MNQANINLHITALILRDFPYTQRHRIAAALQAELTRLLAEGALPSRLTESLYIPQLQIGPLELQTGARPASLGKQIAQQVYQEIAGRSGEPRRETAAISAGQE
jgi:hypothetical protein